MLTSQMDEFLDLVDENDRVIGRKLRSEVYAEKLSNFRVVNAFIVNSEGKLWIPRRAPTKHLYPLGLDMSMGGHVESGEEYEEAFKRETREELNIDLNSEKILYRLLGHLTPDQNGLSAFMNVYEIQMDEAPSYNTDDFVEYFWLTPEELLGMIEKGEKAKSDLPIVVRNFYT